MANHPYLSIAIPVFNEEEVIPRLLAELKEACLFLDKPYEIILVDDGSSDATFDLISKAAAEDKRIKAVRFSRNFGHQAAFTAGLSYAQGDLVITMDGDLQHPPSLIPQFIKYAEEGSDIVIGERTKNKQNSRIRESVGKNFYKILSVLTNLEFRNASDFVLYKSHVISSLKQLPERERFLRGLVQWVGFSKKYIPYEVEERKAGVSKYNFKKLAGLVMSGLTSFSAFPLRLAFWVGLLVLIASVGFSIYVAVDHYINPNPLIAGWATLVVLVLMLGGIQLMVLGIVGEYLYKMFNEVKGRPAYIVSETRNIKKEEISRVSYGIHEL